MTGHDLPPPSYDESASSASASASASTAGQAGQDDAAVSLRNTPTRPQPSASAQRAQGPLLIVRSNERITEDYIVNITEDKTPPDAFLKTTNSTIRSCVYLQGNVPRTAEVTLETTNSSIATMFPDKDDGQAVLFNVRTSNSKVEVAFPPTFNGIVTTKTSNAKINMSDALRSNSMIIPNAPESPSGLTTYRIQPRTSGETAIPDSKTPMDDAQLDICHIVTSNSPISLGYLNEVDDAQAGGKGKKQSSGCIIS